MELFVNLSLTFAILSFVLMLAGLYRPWMMLWWQDTQNRKKVIKIYGSIALFFFILYEVLKHLQI